MKLKKILDDKAEWIEISGHCLLFFVLPISIRLTALATWFLLIVYLFKPGLKNRLMSGLRSGFVWIFSMPFFYMMVTLVYSEEFYLGWKSIENKMFFFLFPLFLSSMTLNKERFNLLLKAFTFSIFFWSFLCLVVGLYNVATRDLTMGDMAGDVYNRVVSRWGYISNLKLMEPIALSPIYMSMFVGLAVFICVYFYRESESRRQRTWIIGIIGYFVLFNFLLGARMGITSLFLILFVYFLKIGLMSTKTINWIPKAVGIGVTVLVMLFFVFNPVLRKRFISDFKSPSFPTQPHEWNSVNLRMAVWSCSVELFKEKPLLGYGIGSADKYREQCYRQFSFYEIFGTDFNSHNQYLEYLLIGGVPLLIVFLFSLGTSFHYAMVFDSDLLKAFILFVIFNLLTESFLNVQKGLIFYIYFTSLFLFGLRSLRSKQPII